MYRTEEKETFKSHRRNVVINFTKLLLRITPRKISDTTQTPPGKVRSLHTGNQDPLRDHFKESINRG